MDCSADQRDLLSEIGRKLDRLLERAAAGPQRFFGVAEAAAYSGLSEESIRRLIDAGKLPALRPVPGRVLVDRREVDALILSSRGRPARSRGVYERANQESNP